MSKRMVLSHLPIEIRQAEKRRKEVACLLKVQLQQHIHAKCEELPLTQSAASNRSLQTVTKARSFCLPVKSKILQPLVTGRILILSVQSFRSCECAWLGMEQILKGGRTVLQARCSSKRWQTGSRPPALTQHPEAGERQTRGQSCGTAAQPPSQPALVQSPACGLPCSLQRRGPLGKSRERRRG